MFRQSYDFHIELATYRLVWLSHPPIITKWVYTDIVCRFTQVIRRYRYLVRAAFFIVVNEFESISNKFFLELSLFALLLINCAHLN